MRAAALVAVSVTATVAIAFSCNNGTSVSPSATDAATADVTPDASDARVADAPEAQTPVQPKPSEIGVEGTWTPAGTLPAFCSFHVSTTPQLIPPFPWKPCKNGMQGCESFVSDWDEQGSIASFKPSTIEPVFEDANGVHITYERQTKAFGTFAVKVVQTMSGAGEAAFAIAVPSCGMIAQSSRNGIALSFVVGEPVQAYLGWTDIGAGSSVTTVSANLTPALNIYQGVARGNGFVAVEATNFGASIYGAAYALGTKQFAGPTPTHSLANDGVLPVEGGYVAVVGTTPATLAFVPLSGGYQILARPSPNMQMAYASVDRKQNTIVWSEFDETDQHVVWSSPFATSDAGIQARRVAKLPLGSKLVANAGAAVALVDSTRARVIRLTDGQGWELPAEPGFNYIRPLWVNDDSVWLLASHPSSGGKPQNAAVRFSRASLGNPTVSSGL